VSKGINLKVKKPNYIKFKNESIILNQQNSVLNKFIGMEAISIRSKQSNHRIPLGRVILPFWTGQAPVIISDVGHLEKWAVFIRGFPFFRTSWIIRDSPKPRLVDSGTWCFLRLIWLGCRNIELIYHSIQLRTITFLLKWEKHTNSTSILYWWRTMRLFNWWRYPALLIAR